MPGFTAALYPQAPWNHTSYTVEPKQKQATLQKIIQIFSYLNPAPETASVSCVSEYHSFSPTPSCFSWPYQWRDQRKTTSINNLQSFNIEGFLQSTWILCNCQKQMIFFKERALQMPLNYFIYKHGSTGDVSIDTEDFQLFLIWWLLAHIVFLIKELACQTVWSWFSPPLPVIKSLNSKGAFYFHRYKYVLKPNIGAYKAELVVKLESDVQVNTALRPKSFLSVAVAAVTVEGSLKCTVAASFDSSHVRTEVTYFTHPPTKFFSSEI